MFLLSTFLLYFLTINSIGAELNEDGLVKVPAIKIEKDNMYFELMNSLLESYPCPHPIFVSERVLEKIKQLSPHQLTGKITRKRSGRRSLGMIDATQLQQAQLSELLPVKKYSMRRHKKEGKRRRNEELGKVLREETATPVPEFQRVGPASNIFMDSDEDDSSDSSYDSIDRNHNYNYNAVLARRNVAGKRFRRS